MTKTAKTKPLKLKDEDSFGVVIAPGTIRFTRLLPGPIERVWEYLTNPKKTALWMGSGKFDLRVGGLCEWHCDYAFNLEPELRKRHNGAVPVVYCRVLELDPPRLLKMTWDYSDCANTSQDGSNSVITYELTPQGSEVVFTLTHTGMPNNNDTRAALAGWHIHFDVLAAKLNGTPPAPFLAAHEALEKEYQQRVTGD